jgi:hypothetical protein
VQAVRLDRYAREKTSTEFGFERNVSASTIQRIFKRNNIHKVKPTRKQGLTNTMKAARLAFCLKYKDWVLEDWKNIIWTDETSVVLGHRRNGSRLWRTKEDRYNLTVIRPRWNGTSEFIFWSCFTYDKKGPYHIWKKEMTQEKKQAQKELDRINAELEPQLKSIWELQTGMRWLQLRGVGGPKPSFKINKANGAVVRDKGKGGIDWYRYQTVILKPKLIPFALECMKEYPNTVVQEDKAPAHASQYQEAIFSAAGVMCLLWYGNSPDLNMIEPCWPFMKRTTTRKGAPTNRKTAEVEWVKYWDNMEQERIQRWIERIVRHIQKVIELEGDNNYREGVMDEPINDVKKRAAERARRNY